MSNFSGDPCLVIEDSYLIWAPDQMHLLINEAMLLEHNTTDMAKLLHRSYPSLYIEWWMHNVGYYITKPFCFNDHFNKINHRCKDVDLEKWE